VIRVLLDCRVRAQDGIGRYTDCTMNALRRRLDSDVEIRVLPQTGARRYSEAEGQELVWAAQRERAHVLHTVDYRVPLQHIEIPLIVTVHDVLRLLHPDNCYSDSDFRSRFGADGLSELSAATSALRDLVVYPSGAMRRPRTTHEEFYARMLMLASVRAAHIVVPTETVRRQLANAVGHHAPLAVSPYGIDHCNVKPTWPVNVQGGRDNGRYLLYVGQARRHKGLPALLEAYERSRARRQGIRLVCVGSDFAPEAPETRPARAWLGNEVSAVGAVSDGALAALYAGAEALVHLADHEGFGFTPLEAMSCGTRVIASDIPVLRETLGPHATFVDPSDPATVAHQIDGVLAVRDEYRDRRRRVRWARRYRWSRHAEDLVTLYRQVAS
jgi:glycosyltransferase involved in cell wall biosynthesis